MADQIIARYDLTGQTLYAQVMKPDGTIWNGSAFVTYATADIGNYDIALTEKGTASRIYAADFPSGITTAGLYHITVFARVGASPAESDTLVGGDTLDWDGTKMVSTPVHDGPALPSGSVVSDGSNSATTFKTDRSETTTDYWKDALLLITSGALIDQIKKVTAYNGTTKFVTVSGGFTGTPANGVTFRLINR